LLTCPSHHHLYCAPPVLAVLLQLKKLYADSREDMSNHIFVPATSFNCDSKEPEKWSFYLRRLLGAPLGTLGGAECGWA